MAKKAPLNNKTQSLHNEHLRFEKLISNLSSQFVNLSINDIDEKIDEGLQLIGEFMGVDRCFIDQFSLDKSKFQLTHMWFADGIPRDNFVFEVVLSEHLPWYTNRILSGNPLIFVSPEEIPEEAVNERRYIRETGLKSSAIVPLQVGKAVIGNFGYDMIRRKRKWLETDIRRLWLLSEVFAGALARKNAAIEIEHSKQRLSSFMEYSPTFMYIKDKSGRHLYGNKSILNFAGLNLQEFIGTTAHDFMPEDIAKKIEAFDREVVEKRMTVEAGEYNFVRDGKLRYFWEIKFPIPLYSGETGSGGIVIEITSLKQKEQSLQKAYDEIEFLKERLEAENIYLRDQISVQGTHENIIGTSDAMNYVLYKIQQVAPSDTTVLVLGETGTGKELVAKAIHRESSRRERPLIKVNCAALPVNLIESELFGREKGAFTGSVAKQIGRFELADKGTIFLDEAGELPLELQAKLLRVIESGEFERLGSPHTVKVDVRIMASTNRDLTDEVKKGRFREDLYYRLNVFPLTVPPLRDRKEDIPVLCNFFLMRFRKKFGKQVDRIPSDVMQSLQNYHWPGNVRELQNVIERAMITSPGPTLQIADMLETFETADHGTSRNKSLSDMERDHILRILEQTRWKIEGKNGAAESLKLNPSTLRTRMRKLGIKRSVQHN